MEAASQMSSADRQQMIRGMVGKLAEAFVSVLRKLRTVTRSVKYPDGADFNVILYTSPWFEHDERFSGDYGRTVPYDFHWHFEIMPKLTKTAGFEWGSGFHINPTSPEDAAAILREVSV